MDEEYAFCHRGQMWNADLTAKIKVFTFAQVLPTLVFLGKGEGRKWFEIFCSGNGTWQQQEQTNRKAGRNRVSWQCPMMNKPSKGWNAYIFHTKVQNLLSTRLNICWVSLTLLMTKIGQAIFIWCQGNNNLVILIIFSFFNITLQGLPTSRSKFLR